MAKDKDYVRMIHSRRWVELRAEKITKNPICERCWEEERLVTPATEVHHVHPVERAVRYEEKERLMFAMGNLRSLCHDCHVRTHTEMGRSGKRQTAERNKNRVEEFKKKFF